MLGVALRGAEHVRIGVVRVEQVLGPEHRGRPPRRSGRRLGGVEQPCRCPSSPPGVDAEDLDVRRGGVVVELPVHLGEADEPAGVERADRGARVYSAWRRSCSSSGGRRRQVGRAERLDVEAPDELGVRGELGAIGCAEVVGR